MTKKTFSLPMNVPAPAATAGGLDLPNRLIAADRPMTDDQARDHLTDLAAQYSAMQAAASKRDLYRNELEQQITKINTEAAVTIADLAKTGEAIPDNLPDPNPAADLQRKLGQLESFDSPARREMERVQAAYHHHFILYFEVFATDLTSQSNEIKAELSKLKAAYTAAYHRWNDQAAQVSTLLGQHRRATEAGAGVNLYGRPVTLPDDEVLPAIGSTPDRLPSPSQIFRAELISEAELDGVLNHRQRIRDLHAAVEADPQAPDYDDAVKAWEAEGRPDVPSWIARSREKVAAGFKGEPR